MWNSFYAAQAFDGQEVFSMSRPKKSCPNNVQCCTCIVKHRETDSLPFCLFPDNEGDKSTEHYYKKTAKVFSV